VAIGVYIGGCLLFLRKVFDFCCCVVWWWYEKSFWDFGLVCGGLGDILPSQHTSQYSY
jgi:hypothetical protein